MTKTAPTAGLGAVSPWPRRARARARSIQKVDSISSPGAGVGGKSDLLRRLEKKSPPVSGSWEPGTAGRFSPSSEVCPNTGTQDADENDLFPSGLYRRHRSFTDSTSLRRPDRGLYRRWGMIGIPSDVTPPQRSNLKYPIPHPSSTLPVFPPPGFGLS